MEGGLNLQESFFLVQKKFSDRQQIAEPGTGVQHVQEVTNEDSVNVASLAVVKGKMQKVNIIDRQMSDGFQGCLQEYSCAASPLMRRLSKTS